MIRTLRDVEKAHILQTLEDFNWNKTVTAEALGITIKTLYNKLFHYGDDLSYKPLYYEDTVDKPEEIIVFKEKVVFEKGGFNVNEVANLIYKNQDLEWQLESLQQQLS